MSSVMDRIGKSWRNAARDVVLIVASILIAFALDAWWDDLKERQAQSEQIETLLSEFETARETLVSLSDYLRGTIQATNELLTMMGPEATASNSETIFALLGRSLNFGASIPDHTALASFLATGNSRIEERASLLGILATWPALLEDLKTDLAHLERNRDVDLQAALVQIGVAGIAATPSVQALGLPPPSFPFEVNKMMRSVTVYATLSYRALRLKVLSLNVEAAIERVDLIIEELARVSD